MNATATGHRHAAINSKERGPFGFTSCVAHHPYTNCNPASHGGVVFIEVCDCGAERKRSSNGRHQEIGTWKKTD